jgi:hypothetical protein
MTLQALTTVRAVRDIHRGRHTVVRIGWPGTIVDSHPSWFEATFTVQFTAAGKGAVHRSSRWSG